MKNFYKLSKDLTFHILGEVKYKDLSNELYLIDDELMFAHLDKLKLEIKIPKNSILVTEFIYRDSFSKIPFEPCYAYHINGYYDNDVYHEINQDCTNVILNGMIRLNQIEEVIYLREDKIRKILD